MTDRRDPPRGMVTFLLFTDIKGSTLLWERDRLSMTDAVARHIALFDAATQTHGGVLFKTVGDAVQVAFPMAPQTVAAALDAQRSLLAEDWGETGPLRVRMALHAGDATPDERGDQLAAPLNRLLRLLSTVHGAVGVTDLHFELFEAGHFGNEYRYPLGLQYLAERLTP